MRFLLRNEFNLNTEVDQLHVVSIFTKLSSKDLNVGGVEQSFTEWIKSQKKVHLGYSVSRYVSEVIWNRFATKSEL